MKPHKISALLVNHSISCKMKLDDTMSKYKKAVFKWVIIKKIRLYPFWCPCWNKPFLHLISCSDDFQVMKFNQIKSHAFLQHSTRLSFYTFVWSWSERSWKMVNSTSEISGVLPLSDLTEKTQSFSVAICFHFWPFWYPYLTTCML